ncbi:MAG: Co2+/Mg2+ efflux protein ApaG [Armatimonadota bacterium]|nr:Co2+/Mg2+ efflux protein ApaG [Armatimonadota bacterium]
MSVLVTEGIKISVVSEYLADESNPEESRYLFSYQVTIANEGREAAQLLTRHWIIKDAENNVEEVRGDGVIRQTPVIEPGRSFTYSSWCQLRTEWGTMRGSYGMERPAGEGFDVIIPPFCLMPHYLMN